MSVIILHSGDTQNQDKYAMHSALLVAPCNAVIQYNFTEQRLHFSLQ
jgi:hypothetical protein